MMFKPSPTLSRADALQSILRRFKLSQDVGRKLLDYFYPVAFWRVLSVSEYEVLTKELLHPQDKKIISILGENWSQ